MAKFTPTTITNIAGNPTTAATNINTNFTALATLVEQFLSRDGTSPNSMGADLDMNNYDINNGKSGYFTALRVGNTPVPGSTTVLTGALTDPNADRILFWDDSAGTHTYLSTSAQLSISGTTLSIGTLPINDLSDVVITSAATNQVLVYNGTNWVNQDILDLQTIWVPAAAMVSRTTNGAASGTGETTTNKIMRNTLDFDTSTQEFAQFTIRMPKSWDEGTVTARFSWSHASTVTNFGVVWALEAVAISDDDALDVAFGTAQQIADTGGTTDDLYITSATPAITIGGTPQAEDFVVFQVKRVPADGSDTLAVDARLHGVTLYYTVDAFSDA